MPYMGDRGRYSLTVAQQTESLEYQRRFGVAAKTARWAVTMTKVRIRQACRPCPWPRWHFLSFVGNEGRESRGIIDLVAIRKDHGTPGTGLKRGDALQIMLIQVKGGSAAKPTAEDAQRLQSVASYHRACGVLYAAWKKGRAARFFALDEHNDWTEVEDLTIVFCSPNHPRDLLG